MRLVAATLILLTACGKGDAQSPVRAESAPMQHYEIRADQLPKAFHTESAGNPPRVVKRPANAKLVVPPGFKISIWADGFEDPRNMVLAPNGDVFVADMGGTKIFVLRDTNGDAAPDQRWTFAHGLNRPFGLAFRGNQLYVGNTDEVVRFDYKPGQTAASGQPVKVTTLPVGGHATRNVIFNRDGTRMYVAVGSASNVSDETDEPLRAAITEYNPDGTGMVTFASGLRNPIGLAWNPADNALWTVVNERDGLGDDLVPDYATEVQRDAFYGWPFSYIGPNVDPRRGERLGLVRRAIVPSVLIQAHSAPITIAFYNGKMFPAQYRGGAFVTLHGSWNRTVPTGAKVVRVKVDSGGRRAVGVEEFINGWQRPDGSRWGRPVGLLVLPDGSLLVSDDYGGKIWRVSYGR